MSEIVIVVATEFGLRKQVWSQVIEQEPRALLRETPVRRPFVYGNVFRAMWAGLTGFIWIEQDVVPPYDAIARLRECPRPWCVHPVWTGAHHSNDTFGIVKFSETMCRNLPLLADIVCTPHDSRYWVRRGWTTIPRDCSVATLNGAGRRACLNSDAPSDAMATMPDRRYTTRMFLDIDTAMAHNLRVLGLEPCVHTPQAKHLHDYTETAPPAPRHWAQLPYDAVDWPAD